MKKIRFKVKPQKKERKPYRAEGKVTDGEWEEQRYLWLNNKIDHDEVALNLKVSRSLVIQKASRDSWAEQKKKFWLEQKVETRRRVLEMFVNAGLPPERLIELISQGATRTTKLQNVKTSPITFTKKTKDGKIIKIKPFTLDETRTVIDNDNTRAYRELAIKVLDMFPAPKSPQQEITEESLPVISHINALPRKAAT